MQVAFHLGAHATDEDRLVRALLRNADTLNADDIAVPAPSRYRMALRDALVALKGDPAPADVQTRLLTGAIDRDPPRRIVFSHDFFLCVPQRVILPQGFYSMAPGKIAPLANLFPEARTEFHLALINPATLIPALLGRIEGASYETLMAGHDPRALRWAPVVRRMVEAAAGRRFVIWCHEDTPLIWPEVMRSAADLPPEAPLLGDFTILSTIMSQAGMKRLRAYLASHPPTTIARRRRIISAFLDKFALPDQIELALPFPGWDEALVEDITAAYEADCVEIAALPGVEFITP